MVDYNEKIKELEAEMSKMQYNKRTQHHYGLIRAKIAKLKERDIKRSSGKGKTSGYSVKKSGDASVILIGFPSAGKSTLLNAITGAESEVAAYEFTTLDVVPGLLKHKHAQIQMLDVPGIVHGAASGRGRGKEVLAVMRSANLAVVVIDVHKPEQCPALLKEVYDSGLRLNKEVPIIKISKKTKGGLDIAATVKLKHITKATIAAILKEFRIFNADVVIRSDITVDDLIDSIEANKIYIPAIVVINKIDSADEEVIQNVVDELSPDLCISANEGTNIDRLKDLIFDGLDFMRVYCKEVGKPADMDVPLIINKKSTIKDMCEKLHRDFVNKFKFARVWGPSAKFPGQKFLYKHKLKDEDIVELHIR